MSPYADPEKRREKQREYNANYLKRNPEKARESSRRYYWNNQEKALESGRRWREANREKSREASRRWAAANPEKVRAYSAANRERQREINRRNYRDHPEVWRIRLLWHRHRMWPEDWEAMYAAQGGLCWLCGKPMPSDPSRVVIDHDHRCCPALRSCPRCRRGLAHPACNKGIGHFGDDPELMRRIASNLEMWQRDHDVPEPLTLF